MKTKTNSSAAPTTKAGAYAVQSASLGVADELARIRAPNEDDKMKDQATTTRGASANDKEAERLPAHSRPISRRIFAAGLALAPVAGLPAIAASPPLDARSPALRELWQEWLSLGEMIAGVDAKRDAAYGALP